MALQNMTDADLIAAAVEATAEARRASNQCHRLRREIERRDGKRFGRLARRRNAIDGRG